MKPNQFYKNAAFVLVFNGLTLGCGLLKNIILGRFLSEADFGLYSLLLAIAGFIYPLSLVGQQTSLVRFLSSNDVQSFNCVKGVAQILAISFLLILVSSLVASKVYSLGLLALVFVIIFSFSNSITDLLPGVLRSQGIYTLSIIMFRGVNIFLVISLIILVTLGRIQVESVLWSFLFISSAFALITSALAIKYFGKGEKGFPTSLWKDGALLLGTHLSLLVIVSIDRLLIPKLISFEALGLYFAISAVMRLFEIAVQSIEFVLLPDINRLSKSRILWLTVIIIAAALFLTASYSVAGSYIVALVYGGKYDHGIHLIPYFCAIGFLSFAYVIPYTIISGRLSSKCLQHLLYGNTIAMVTNIALSILFIPRWGLVGAACATIIVWLIRLVIALAIVYFERGSLRIKTQYR